MVKNLMKYYTGFYNNHIIIMNDILNDQIQLKLRDLFYPIMKNIYPNVDNHVYIDKFKNENGIINLTLRIQKTTESFPDTDNNITDMVIEYEPKKLLLMKQILEIYRHINFPTYKMTLRIKDINIYPYVWHYCDSSVDNYGYMNFAICCDISLFIKKFD